VSRETVEVVKRGIDAFNHGPPTRRGGRAATGTSATPPRCGASRSTLELADQEGAWFGHYDLNEFRFLVVRKRKLAEERRKAAVPGR
jgi:hypothetical protein